MILLWGPRRDPPLAAVVQALARRGVAHVLVDPDDEDVSVVRPWHSTGDAVLEVAGRSFSLDAIDSAYLRPHPLTRPNPSQRILLGTLLSWADTTKATVVNRPMAMTANTSKPFQLRLIAAHGFAVPPTLVTTDPAAVRGFQDEFGEVIYKSLSATRSIVRRLSPERQDDLQRVVHCPTQFQEYIPGDDVRVHVVGSETHALRIACSADDYRYARATAAPAELPPYLSERIVTMVGQMGLLFAGVDLRHDPDGRWYCLEVNPSPGFTYYERLAPMDLTQAVIRLLLRDSSSRPGAVSAERPCSPRLRPPIR